MPTDPNNTRLSADHRRRLSGPGLRTFEAIADLWDLNQVERLLVLGSPPPSTYEAWLCASREHGDLTLPVETLMRLSAVLGVHKALQILFSSEPEGVTWLCRPHAAPSFGGQAPISLLTGGTLDGVMTVRCFLDAALGGTYMPPCEAADGSRSLADADIFIA